MNFIRIESPRHASQLSECGGAGTGCGWCRPFLEQLLAEYKNSGEDVPDVLPSAAEYATSRSQYVKEGGGNPPPGATPIDP